MLSAIPLDVSHAHQTHDCTRCGRPVVLGLPDTSESSGAPGLQAAIANVLHFAI